MDYLTFHVYTIQPRIQHIQYYLAFCLYLFGRRDNAFVLSTLNVIQRPLEMTSWILESRRVFVGIEVGMDEFDQAIQVFRRNLSISAFPSMHVT